MKNCMGVTVVEALNEGVLHGRVFLQKNVGAPRRKIMDKPLPINLQLLVQVTGLKWEWWTKAELEE
jgi:hypothetical protein